MLHLSRKDFYDMRPGEFWEALHAHVQERDAGRQHVGELIRGATLRLFNIQLLPKDRIKDTHEFWPMPWDIIAEGHDSLQERITRIKNMTPEERNAAAQDFLSKIK